MVSTRAVVATDEHSVTVRIYNQLQTGDKLGTLHGLGHVPGDRSPCAIPTKLSAYATRTSRQVVPRELTASTAVADAATRLQRDSAKSRAAS